MLHDVIILKPQEGLAQGDPTPHASQKNRTLKEPKWGMGIQNHQSFNEGQNWEDLFFLPDCGGKTLESLS